MVKLTLELDSQSTIQLIEEAAQAGKTLEQLVQEKLVGQMGVVSVKVKEVMSAEGEQNESEQRPTSLEQ